MAHPFSGVQPRSGEQASKNTSLRPAYIAGSAATQGSRVVPSAEVDRAFGMPEGKLRRRAGIESLAYVAQGENELSLGTAAAQEALRGSDAEAGEIDWVVATSETHHNYPSLAAQLHSRLRVREDCAALDVGGGCLGLLNAFAVAQSLIGGGQARAVAVVSADVHSRTLTPGRVAGEFGGLFGDGASAFVLHRASGADETANAARNETRNGATKYALGEFLFGCAGRYAAAVCVSDDKVGGLTLQFDGDALSRAAIGRMEKTIAALELRSGISRACVGAFATHQPNPRLMALFARQCGVSETLFPEVARTAGNLGSSTCGAALHLALSATEQQAPERRKPIFLASLGPGLLFGGGWIKP